MIERLNKMTHKNEDKELKVQKWFAMWLNKICQGIKAIFCTTTVYVESWGLKYIGIKAIQHWFEKWNTRGSVMSDIKQFFYKDEQTIVEWYFCNEMDDGRTEELDGLSLIQWKNGKICFLKEYGCNINNYNTYEESIEPVFGDEKSRWF